MCKGGEKPRGPLQIRRLVTLLEPVKDARQQVTRLGPPILLRPKSRKRHPAAQFKAERRLRLGVLQGLQKGLLSRLGVWPRRP
jgi:hypothetical protein